jgi:hypothetical protein
MVIQDCCPGVTTPPVNIPGPEGKPGTPGADGADGVSAFTITTSDFILPSVNGSVTIAVANSLPWMVPGENFFISDGTNLANFRVSSVPNAQSAVLIYLGYTGDSAPGTTIASGAGVTPSGLAGATGASGKAVTGTISAAVGLSQALTTTPNTQVGSVSLTLSATSGETYLLFARCRLDYVGTTIGNQTIRLAIRRTNNTAGDIPNAIAHLLTQAVNSETSTAGELTILAIPYTTQGVSDVVQCMVSIDAAPYAGSIEAVECSLSAVQLTS